MRGLEKIWIIGDDFTNHTFTQHYKNIKNKHGDNDLYAFKNFEVREFSSNRYDSLFRNTTARIRNSYMKAVNEHNTLPKLIVIILDDDLAISMKENDPELSLPEQLHIATSWLATEFEKSMDSYKDLLPQRSKKENFPHFLWICPPTNCNFGSDNNDLRNLQTNCIDEIIKTKKRMSSLRMIKVWEHDDRGAFLEEAYRFTLDGLDTYWASIDSAIRYWDMILINKILDSKKEKFSGKNPHFNDKYHWSQRRFKTPHNRF